MSEYSKKYKWLRLLNPYTGKLYQNKDAIDEMINFAPEWTLAFSGILCKKLDDSIKRADVENTFVFVQGKEKFGQRRKGSKRHARR